MRLIAAIARHFCLAATLIGAAGMVSCSDPPDEQEILSSAASLPQPQPGLYRSTTTVVRYDLPDASPQEADRMRALMGNMMPSAREFCMSAEDAADGWAAMIQQAEEGSCSFDRFDVEGNRLGATMACAGVGGITSRIDVLGTASATSSSMNLVITQNGEDIPGGEQVIEMQVASERLGDCPPV